MKYSMRPGPHETPPPNPAGRAIFEGILASGKIPAGRQSPERALPPADTTETTIDEFLNTLTHFQSYSGDFAPHHMFGAPSRAEFAQFHMIHCAHHLGHLIPNS